MPKLFSRVRGLVNNRSILTWTTKGGMAIVDQGLITGSNFLLSILLARWLSRDEYGAFALGFAVFLLVATLYQALLLEPMSVFGGSVYHSRLGSYLRALMGIHLCATLAILGVLGFSALAVRMTGQGAGLCGALAGAAVAAPGILLLWMARRAFYLQLSSAFAVIGAIVYCILVIGGLFLAHSHGSLSSHVAFALMGAGGLFGGAMLLLFLFRQFRDRGVVLHLREVWSRHWKYGQWALLAAAAMWVPANMFYPVVSSFRGVASTAELKALLNFFNPIFQTYAALSLLLLPYASRQRSQRANLGTLTWRITLLCTIGTVVYWLIAVVFAGPAFRLLYSGRYIEVAHLMPVVALGSIFENAFFGPAIVLRAMESPKSVFASLFAAAGFSLVVGIPATWAFGVTGAVWVQSLSSAVTFVVAVLLLLRKLDFARASTLGKTSPLAVTQLEAEI
jgi:O-antigen/teichoic acid export membrane protein